MSDNIRNFALVAHIDHGKSTLSDRLIELCGGLEKRQMREQTLDNMDIERERGITIKAQTARLIKTYQGKEYILNLLDTPGHMDFSYEVSRSLAACEGTLLIVDASQGIQAQTIANAWVAVEANTELIPVFNKIDLTAADVPAAKKQLEEAIGLDCGNAVEVSAKTGQGLEELLERIITALPPPKGDAAAALRALVVDSWYDPYLGVVALVRIMDGVLTMGMRFRLIAAATKGDVLSVAVFTPLKKEVEELKVGEIGAIATGLKQAHLFEAGDTLVAEGDSAAKPLSGFQKQTAVVFCGIYPTDADRLNALKIALSKLILNDGGITSTAESSTALGQGFRCGFLGLLHMEVSLERLSREFAMEIISTAPGIICRIHRRDGGVVEISNPKDMPPTQEITEMEEPWIKLTIVTPGEHLGAVMGLCADKRGQSVGLTWSGKRAISVWQLPLSEIVFDFNDRLKSLTKGYASYTQENVGYKVAALVAVNILINDEPSDALCFISHIDNAERRGRVICKKLKELIPRQLFKVPIQAAIGGRIVASETLSAMRKDVTAKCYGGDVSRKRKLLEKQKAGKKKMQSFGRVEVPHSVFVEALKP